MNNGERTLIPQVLRCLLQPDPETGRWNGHCLDLDIATSGTDPETTWQQLRSVVRMHVENCFTQWQKGLTRRATPNEIAVFEELSKTMQVRCEKISFKLIPPAKEPMAPLWIKAVELEGKLDESACATVQ